MGGIEWMERDFQENDTNRSNIAGTFNRSRNGLFGFILEYPPTLHPQIVCAPPVATLQQM